MCRSPSTRPKSPTTPKKYGGFIQASAGPAHGQYLGYVLNRLTAPGSVYLGTIADPDDRARLSRRDANIRRDDILIAVVGLDTVKQIESQLQRNYEGFLR